MTDELRALRTGAVACVLGDDGVLRVSGPAAWDALDRLLPCDLFLRDGQARQTLLLDPDTGAAVADLLVLADGDDLLLLADGIGPDALAEAVRGRLLPGEDAVVVREDRVWLEVTGPFAWEWMSAFDRPALVGLAYLHHVRLDGDVICVRAGRTGEFAYDLLVPRERADAVRARLLATAGVVEGREVPRAVLDRAALENWFWIPGTPGLEGLDPLELQLQWRLSWDKDVPGLAVLRARRAAGGGRRLVAFRTAGDPRPGDPVTLGDEVVGVVRLRLPGAGYASIDPVLAHPGVPWLSAGGAALALVSPPLVENRSLFVKPQRHRYATRDRQGP